MRSLTIALFALVLVAGCTPAQTAAWHAVGVDAVECAKPDVVPLVAAGEQAVLDVIAAHPTDFATIGKDLGLKYGLPTLWCILKSLASRLGPVLFGELKPGDPRPAIQWLMNHPSSMVRR